MDKYLIPHSAYERLLAEYNKHNSLIIGVDYDDTLFDFHKTGESYEMVQQLVRDLHSIGCKIIIWSGSENYDEMSAYLKKNNIPFDLINENLKINGKFVLGRDPRKIYANAYIDDRGGLIGVYNDLSRLVKEIKHEKE